MACSGNGYMAARIITSEARYYQQGRIIATLFSWVRNEAGDPLDTVKRGHPRRPTF